MDNSPRAAKEKLIVALDVPTKEKAVNIIESLGNQVNFFKVGLELFTAGAGREITQKIIKANMKAFVDLKLYDIPVTVNKAVAQIIDTGAQFLTVHGSKKIMTAAANRVAQAGSDLKIIAVSPLTSMDESNLKADGVFLSTSELTCKIAENTVECGCHGITVTGAELLSLSKRRKNNLITVTPGVSMTATGCRPDQKRVTTLKNAIRAGSDYIVMGRVINESASPEKTVSCIIQEMNEI